MPAFPDKQVITPGPARELLRGYRRLRAISFSASLQGWQGLLEGYEQIELLISLEEGYHELQPVAWLRQEIGSLLPILLQQQAEIRFLPGSHAKLYLLEGPPGCRVIFGSLNLSQAAWEGGQAEIAAYSDRPEVYRALWDYYQEERERSRLLFGARERQRLQKPQGLLPVLVQELPPKERQELQAQAAGLLAVNLAQNFPQEALDKSRVRQKEGLRALRELQKETEHLEHKPHEGGSPRDFAQQVSEDLLLAFLREAYPGERELERLLQGEDPLEPARSFLRSLGVAVPERPVGDYREYMRRCWRSLYYTQREAFQEIEMPDARSGRLVPCFVVEKERVGFLTPLQAFDNGTAGNHKNCFCARPSFLRASRPCPLGAAAGAAAGPARAMRGL
ncbi:hypothetical protein Mlute_01906 [Meiothermus luteus]|jgi:hypothetical protein|uniref:Phospholipase D-like domain-containing protein n=1 Tax=Meiothermus luteus TaxID=2026184 RepID=A0A399ELM2_9DEIN|nr:phospholipase D family protein [Meiothermus luteus]RIH84373.1 hypothetical protein Mlute_01906 [Meiothermus luteus]